FAHGGNDGQKGMGLIMLILIGAVPTAYALNRTMPESATPAFIEATMSAQNVFAAHAGTGAALTPEEARRIVGDGLRDKTLNRPEVVNALAVLSGDIAKSVRDYGALSHIPAAVTPNLRNDMYLTGDAIRLLPKEGAVFSTDENATLKTYTGSLQAGTRFI